MSILEKLTLTTTSPRQPQTPLARKRVRLLQKLELQIALAEAEAKDELFMQEVQRWIRDEDTGEKCLVTKQLPVRKWWWQNEHGAWMISLRDGSKIVPLTEDNTSVEVGHMEDMVSSLQTLRAAVIAGELDVSLETLIYSRKPIGKSKDKTQTKAA